MITPYTSNRSIRCDRVNSIPIKKIYFQRPIVHVFITYQSMKYKLSFIW